MHVNEEYLMSLKIHINKRHCTSTVVIKIKTQRSRQQISKCDVLENLVVTYCHQLSVTVETMAEG